VRPEVFVAMSFAESLESRFSTVIEPAIEAVEYRGETLKAKRVDLSKSGDSILTDIADGIAHSAMVLADVSVIGYDAKSGQSYRNGNVMYEVGLALACRQSAEVLLIRDDRDPFLFDVSTVPHMHVDFSEKDTARTTLTQEIELRLREIDHVQDARVSRAMASLTSVEGSVLASFAENRRTDIDQIFWLLKEDTESIAATARLLDKQLIRTRGVTETGIATFSWTQLGLVVAENLRKLLPIFALPKVETKAAKTPPVELDTGAADEGT